jgi:hypothetical protein
MGILDDIDGVKESLITIDKKMTYYCGVASKARSCHSLYPRYRYPNRIEEKKLIPIWSGQFPVIALDFAYISAISLHNA